MLDNKDPGLPQKPENLQEDLILDWTPREKVILRCCDVLCVLAIVSLSTYALTGYAVWKEIGTDGFGRVVVMIMLFAAALFAPLGGRLLLMAFRGTY